MKTPLRVLILEDRAADAELMLHELRRAGFEPDWQRVETEPEFTSHLDPTLDIILADYTLPQFVALQALHLLQERELDIPFIVVTGSISEEVAVECMKQGADDYLLKDRMGRLGLAVKHALEEKQLREERRQGEAALQESEKRYRRLYRESERLREYTESIVATMAEGLLMEDPEGHITLVNQQLETMLGYPAGELVGKHWTAIVPPGEHSTVSEQYARRPEGKADTYETLLLAKDGREIPVLVSATPFMYEEQFSGVLATFVDITEQVLTIEALKMSEARFRGLVRTAPDGIVIVDGCGSIVLANEQAGSMFGYGTDELIDQPIETLLPERYRTSHVDLRGGYMAAPRARPMGQGLELSGRRKDGSEFPVEISLSPLETETGLLVTAIVRDITKRVQAEEEIRKLSRAVDYSASMVIIYDTEGQIEYVNPKFTEITEYATEEIIGKNIATLGGADPVSFQSVWQVIKDGSEFRGDFLNHKKSGATYWVSASISPIRDPNGHISHYVELQEDITERVQREREREALLTVAAALRTAENKAEMLPVLLDEVLKLLQARGAALALVDPVTDEPVIELGQGVWSAWSGTRLPAGKGVSGHVISSGQPYLTDDAQNDPHALDSARFKGLAAVVCVPLVVQEQTIGVLWAGCQTFITKREVRLLTAVADMAANAIHRTTLHEQTERRLKRLNALRTIDQAITASLDLQLILSVLLDQVTAQLEVDAAEVLLFNPHTHTLDYSAGRGFRTTRPLRAHLRLGEGSAGRAALERRLVSVPDLSISEIDSTPAPFQTTEGFVAYHAAPLVAKGQLRGVLEIFHRSLLETDQEWLDFLETLAGQAAIAIDNATLFKELQRSNAELLLSYDSTLEGWVHALDLRDKETEGHTQRVTVMTVLLAETMGVGEAELVHVRRGALLHDIGKMGIPDSILRKPGPLTDEEWEIMRRHPVYAYEWLSPIPYLRPALDIPYCHHEKWDGMGYPQGLKGVQIPLAARVFAVVDVWDALSSDRPYRAAWPEEKVLAHLKEQAGKHFDPQVVEAFLRVLEEDRDIS